jgi:hypothetical protein
MKTELTHLQIEVPLAELDQTYISPRLDLRLSADEAVVLRRISNGFRASGFIIRSHADVARAIIQRVKLAIESETIRSEMADSGRARSRKTG